MAVHEFRYHCMACGQGRAGLCADMPPEAHPCLCGDGPVSVEAKHRSELTDAHHPEILTFAALHIEAADGAAN